MSAPNTLKLPETLSALLREHSLAEALAHVEQTLRRKPDLSGHLLRLDLLCLLGDWERAARQGETCTRFDASCLPLMALIHALTACEKQREAVFSGTATPAIPEAVFAETESATPSTPPSWLALQLQALQAQTVNPDTADTLRTEALSQAPESPGQAELSGNRNLSFQWIADSDTRLGPVMEIFTQDQYLWMPFVELEELEIAPPTALRDFIWLPAVFVTGGQRRHGFLPGRYPHAGTSGDTLALGRETRWQNVGTTGVFAQGQKVLSTDTDDLPLYELRRLRLGIPA